MANFQKCLINIPTCHLRVHKMELFQKINMTQKTNKVKKDFRLFPNLKNI